MSPKRGRPKTGNAKEERIHLRATKQEKEEILNFSHENNITVLELIKLGVESLKK